MHDMFHARAETVLESIIAVAVFMFILGPAAGLYVSSNRTILENRNMLIAATLAEEGLEMMRNFRDTNFLRFSSRADAATGSNPCWNTKPSATVVSSCHWSSNKIAGLPYTGASSAYRLKMDTLNWSWALENIVAGHATQPLHRNSSGEYDLAGTNDGDYRLNYHTGTNLYNYDAVSLSTYDTATDSCKPPAATCNKYSNYYRQISVQYLDIPGTATTTNWFDRHAMEVTVTVLYRGREQGTAPIQEVTRSMILTRQPR